MSNEARGRRSVGADRIGRALCALAAVTTLLPFVDGIFRISDAADADVVVETWRTLGYFVFAGLWALLAIFPRRMPGVWELVILNKAALTVLYFAFGDVPDAARAVFFDGAVTLATVAAYWLCRGWESWRVLTPARPAYSTEG